MRSAVLANFGRGAAFGLLLAGAIGSNETASAQTGPGASASLVLGFEMWCLEIELLPPARCGERRSGDVKSYEQYRAAVESYRQEQSARARREREFSERLQRDPTATSRTQAGIPR